MEGENIRRDDFKWETLGEWCRNLAQWKLSGIYEGNPSGTPKNAENEPNGQSFVARQAFQWWDWVAFR